jgi:AraC-like DNA-binding protein
MQKGDKTVQFESIEIFDTVELSAQEPVMPTGYLHSYYPSTSPEALHYHNFLEIGYCEYGSGIFVVDCEVVPFNDKCACIIYEGQPHIALSVDSQKSLWHFLYISVDDLYAGHNTWGLSLFDRLQTGRYDFTNLIAYGDDPALYELVRLIIAEASTKNDDYLDVIRGLVYSLLLNHNRSKQIKMTAPHTERRRLMYEIADVLNYINLNYMNAINLDILTGISNISKAGLQRKFHAVTGMSPMHYLHHVRLNRAAALLMAAQKNIVEIAMEVGYNSLSSFNRRFLETYKISPSAWRKSQMRK